MNQMIDLNYPDFPALVPKPVYAVQTGTPVVSLNGPWQFLFSDDPEKEALTPGTDERYREMEVPSWISRLHQKDFLPKYLYKKTVSVTEDMKKSHLLLRFEGVNGTAKVYLNGEYLTVHYNSFITWNLEIPSRFYKEANSFELAVTVDESTDRVSTWCHGGILHPVYLYLLPESYLSALHTTTTFDEDFHNAKLRIDFGIRSSKKDCETLFSCPPVIPARVKTLPGVPEFQKEALNGDFTVRTYLMDPEGSLVPQGCRTFLPSSCASSLTCEIPTPKKWDAEHPSLYTLDLELFSGNILLERISLPFGFRQIDKKGNELFINGQAVKLRGSCRHEVTPLKGRAVTPELIEEDVRLFKEANCNYIRTSHYPPSEYFLELCDRYGLYVEDELALAFIARTLDYTQQDPAEMTRYLTHFSELVSRDYSHPSVIMWSLCNESFSGVNFNLLNLFAKAWDPTRVTKFSYPMTIREEYEPADIWSIHYANWNSDLAEKRDNVSVGGSWGKDVPIIHDEYVHVPCYNRTEQRRDPNVREFWGASIARFWDSIWNTKGALGGAIWAGIDETDVYLGGKTCLEWGIIDIWRRKKPEHYGTRKAYTPVLLRGVTPLTEEIASDHGRKLEQIPKWTEKGLALPVENRFCHTNLKDTVVSGWYLDRSSLEDGTIEECCGLKGSAKAYFCLAGPDVEPFASGTITLPDTPVNGFIYLEWQDSLGNVVDEYLIPTKPLPEKKPSFDYSVSLKRPEVGTAPDTGDCIISGTDFNVIFSGTTGLFLNMNRNRKTVISGGPFLHVPYLKLKDWKRTSFYVRQPAGKVCVITSGSYGGDLDVTYTFTILPDGTITIRYRIDAVRVPMPNAMKLRVGVDCGGLDEFGITLEVPSGADTLLWDRTGALTIYPEDSVGRCRGLASISAPQSPFGEIPKYPWRNDSRHDILTGKYDPGIKGTNDFCSLKADVKKGILRSSENMTSPLTFFPASLSPEEAGENILCPLHIRAEAAPDQKFTFGCRDKKVETKGTWYTMHDTDCQSSGTELWSNEEGAEATIHFSGTGIVWYAPVDVNYGKAEIFLDGESKGIINQRVDGVDFPSSAAGYDKKYGYPVWSAKDLAPGDHTLTIRVLGTHAPDSCDSYIVLEQFVVLDPAMSNPVLLHLLADYNYPHIAWGNCCRKPISLKEGSAGAVTVKI